MQTIQTPKKKASKHTRTAIYKERRRGIKSDRRQLQRALKDLANGNINPELVDSIS